MDNTSYIALSRIDALTRALDVTSNNLANANTDGFKLSRVQFSDYLSKQKDAQGTGTEKVIHYAQDRATYKDQMQGTLRQTGNPLDLALNGEGYFTVRTPNGIRLTRNGQFHRSNDGTIVNGDGYPILDDQNRNIVLDPQDQILPLGVSSDGTISTEKGAIASLNVVDVDNENTLKDEGNHLLNPTTQTHQVTAKEVRQGMLESSNVNAIAETTNMIRIQRAYDLNFQLVQTESTRRLNAIDKITADASS